MKKNMTAKIFQNGQSQAVRLPKEGRFSGNYVYVRKQDKEAILSPTPFSWSEFFRQPSTFGEDYLANRENTSPQEKDNPSKPSLLI